MTDHQFDELFRNRLKDYSSQVPENFWQRIQPEDKDRKGFIFWIWHLIIPICLLSGVAGALYYKSTRPITRNTSSRSSAFPVSSPRATAYAILSTSHSSISAATPSTSVIDPTAPSMHDASTTGSINHPTGPSTSAANATNHPDPLVSAATTTPARPDANPPAAPVHTATSSPSHSDHTTLAVPHNRTYPTHTTNTHTNNTHTAGSNTNIDTYATVAPADHPIDPSAGRRQNLISIRNTTAAHHPDHLVTAHNHNTNPVSNPGTDSAILTHSQLPGITPIPNIPPPPDNREAAKGHR